MNDSTFQREDRYIVIKRSDLKKVPVSYRSSLVDPMFSLLSHLPRRECLVIESDWPEYERYWQMIERRMTGQPEVCKHEWTDDGEFLLVCTKCGTQENHDPKWRDMDSAPKDGTLLRLLVSFDEHSTEDADEAPTIGANNYDNDGEDAWRFAGWCWSHDHFTQGVGTPVGWLPMIEASASTAKLDRVTAERDALQQRLTATDERWDELVSAVRSINRSPQYKVMVIDDDEPQYRQRKEWIEWVLGLCDTAPTSGERSNKDYAIEHAEYMAKSADDVLAKFQAYGLALLAFDEGGDDGEGELLENIDSARGDLQVSLVDLRSMVYEFRKRSAKSR